MNNAERIRNFTDDQMENFLFNWGLTYISGFMEGGGAGVMNGRDIHKWLRDSDFACPHTTVGEGFNFDSSFRTRGMA